MFTRCLVAMFLFVAYEAHAHTFLEQGELPSTPEEVCTLEQPREAYHLLRVWVDHSDYSECTRSAHDDRYWQCMAECEEKGLGKNIGGGCAHQVGTNNICSIKRTDPLHCQIFRKSPELSEREEMEKMINRFCVENGFEPLRFR